MRGRGKDERGERERERNEPNITSSSYKYGGIATL